MARRRDIATDELSNPADDRPSLALARTLSILFSPPLVAVATYLFVALIEPGTLNAALGWMLLTMVAQLLPCSLLYIYRRRTGAYRDADVSVRQDRNELYLLGALSVLLSVGLLSVLGAPPALLALAIGTLIVCVFCGLINLFWKISMHAAAIGALATIVAIYAPRGGVALWACALAVGWARVKTRNHTLLQVLAGLGMAAAATLGAFTLVAGE